MSENDVAVLLRDLARPTQPDEDFRASLFRDLVGQIDFEHGRPRSAARSTRLRWLPAQRSSVVWVAFLVLLLLAALVGSAILGRPPIVTPVPISTALITRNDSGPPSPGDARELISRSEAVMLNAPSFDMTATYAGTTIRYEFAADRHLLRGQVVVAAVGGREVGSWFVFDGRTYYEFDASGSFTGAYSAIDSSGVRYPGALGWWRPVHPNAQSWPLAADVLAWPPLGDQSPPHLPDCSNATWVGLEVVAHREADHVRCDSTAMAADYWIDRASGLLLEVAPSFGEPAVAETVRDVPDASAIDVSIPAGPGGEPPIQRASMTAGDYAVNRFEVPFTISLDDGWSTDYDWPAGGRLVRADLTRIAWALPVHTFDTQTGVNSPISIADSREFVGYFTAHHPLDYKTPVETRLAGYSGFEWEVRLKSGTACPVDAKSCDLESPSTTWRARTLALDSPHGVVVLSYEATDDAGMDRARSQLATLRFY